MPGSLDYATLHAAALAHLARFATTEAGLLRVLQRRIQRWATAARAADPESDIGASVEAAQDVARQVVARLAEAKAVDDVAFARARAGRLSRGGRSRRVIAAHLNARGVGSETASDAITAAGIDEFAAALAFARRRRIGPFRSQLDGEDLRLRDLGVLARAGFPRDVAERVLGLSLEAAQAMRESNSAD